MRTYHHLSNEQRYHIYLQLKNGHSQRHIARELSLSPSTICRELRRNRGGKGYRPKQAQHLATQRRQATTRHVQLTDFARAFIAHKLTHNWSPEQIHLGLTTQGWQGVPSHEHIYQYILADKRAGGTLHTHLRLQKTYRKRYGSGQQRRGQLINVKRIIERPELVNQRSRIGDYEGDTLIGKHHKGAIVSLVERKSLYTHVAVLPNRTAANTAQACVKLLQNVHIHTLTFDNGKEFAHHQTIANATGADIYFADPYHSNQRARNENTNGLIRQYCPKKSVFTHLTDQHMQHIMNQLNHRPRKTLGGLTPTQIMAYNPAIKITHI